MDNQERIEISTKLKTTKGISQSAEVRELCQILLRITDLVQDKPVMGFQGKAEDPEKKNG